MTLTAFNVTTSWREITTKSEGGFPLKSNNGIYSYASFGE